MINRTTPDFRLFWTAYDPLDLASGSIDVLGFQLGYIALANKLLPGFTTVTTSPRYVSMLCAAVGAAEAAFPSAGDSAVRIRQTRMAGVKSYERAWALACGLAATEAAIGNKAVDGLRGVQYVRRRLSELSGREKSIRTSSFNLLANQVRYGGIGAYSTLLEDCHLASMRSIMPRPLGTRLAESFPRPDDSMTPWDEDRPLPLDALRAWGQKCHLGDFTRDEGTCLASALRGGEEGGWEDDVRWTSLRVLANFGEDVGEEPALLDRLLAAIRGGGSDRLKMPAPCVRQIEASLILIRPYERLYQAVQFLFDSVRAAATDEPEVRLESLAPAPQCVLACEGARDAATELLDALEKAEAVHTQTAHEVRSTFAEAGIASIAETLSRPSKGDEVLGLVLDRHRDVQQGKFHRGERKAAWVRRDPANGSVRLNSQRHQLPRSDRYDSWDQLPWHPYRTFGARRFVKACGIR
jgi:hypothetical protein